VQRAIQIDRELAAHDIGRLGVTHALLGDERVDVHLDRVAGHQADEEERQGDDHDDRQHGLHEGAYDGVAVGPRGGRPR
jgi:hypothetical protein